MSQLTAPLPPTTLKPSTQNRFVGRLAQLPWWLLLILPVVAPAGTDALMWELSVTV